MSEVIKSLGKGETNILIKTNPADAQLIQENIPDIYPYGDSSTKITVIKDEEVDWGSCIVETKSGIIDARFSTQLQILQKALEAAYREGSQFGIRTGTKRNVWRISPWYIRTGTYCNSHY